MNKELIIKMLNTDKVELSDLNTFISDYTKFKLNKDITAQELAGIIQAIQMRIFDLRFALVQAARDLDLNVLTILDKTGKLITTEVYESF